MPEPRKVDVDVDVLRSLVAGGDCVAARAVVAGHWTEDDLHTEGCDWCHLAWCIGGVSDV